MIELEPSDFSELDFIPEPYREVAYRVNHLFGSEVPDEMPLSWVTNHYTSAPAENIDRVIARKYDLLWRRVFSSSSLKERSMISRAFKALSKTPLVTVGDFRVASETQIMRFPGMGHVGFVVSKACLEFKSTKVLS